MVRAEPPINIEDEASANATKTAVIVCHGMGQQVRFETLNNVADLLRRTDRVRGSVVTRLVRFGDGEMRGRVELALDTGQEQREVHLYEIYWAPLTEGKISLRDVVAFLARSGFDGCRFSLGHAFTRFVFNRWVEFPKPKRLFVQFAIALLVLGALVSLNLSIAGVVSARLVTGGGGRFANTALFEDLTGHLWSFALFVAPFVIGLFVTTLWREHRQRRIPRPVHFVLSAWMWLAILGTIWWGYGFPYHIVEHSFEPTPTSPDLRQTLTLAAPWIIAVGISAVVRRFLVQYVGDVTAYLSSHRLSRFSELRDAIQAEALAVARAVYTEGQYGSYVIVGHSLGSVVAYDTLNALINQEGPRIVSLTARRLTFGSPLDKTAFIFRTQKRDSDVREALAEATQPVIADGRLRPPWVNIYSRRDPISGRLDYYDDPKGREPKVRNTEDPDADIPIVAHTQYWANPLLANELCEACCAGLTRRAAPVDKFFDSDFVRIRYVEQGNGEPVVLIHGFTSNVEQNWIDTGFLPELAKHYHVIALDCRGHGKSGKPHDPKQYGRQMGDDVVRLLDHLRIQKAHIVGYSMGGGITAQLLTLHPERLITATLGGAAGAGVAFDRETWAAEIERGTMPSIVLALWPADQPKPTEEQIQKKSAQFLGGNDRLALAAVLRAGLVGTTQTALASVQVPVLGVAGTADPALNRLNALNPLMPQLTVVAIQGAGHEAAFSRPEFVQAVESFLAAHPAAQR